MHGCVCLSVCLSVYPCFCLSACVCISVCVFTLCVSDVCAYSCVCDFVHIYLCPSVCVYVHNLIYLIFSQSYSVTVIYENVTEGLLKTLLRH